MDLRQFSIYPAADETNSVYEDESMKRFFYLVTMIGVVFVVPAFAQKAGAESDVNFQRYDSYFARNDTGLKGRTSYLVLTSQAKFDKIFHPAPTMGQNNFLPEKTFDTKVVVATIMRGKSLRTYDVSKVTAKNGRLYVWYTVKDSKPGGATYQSPLILAVDRGHYSHVVFMQDGKRVRVVPFPRT
jgi:hypothetical protein